MVHLSYAARVLLKHLKDDKILEKSTTARSGYPGNPTGREIPPQLKCLLGKHEKLVRYLAVG